MKIEGLFEVTPKTIYSHMEKYVYGQDEAKQLVSNMLFMHLAYAVGAINEELADHDRIATNLLLTGPSGFGKTYILRTGCKSIGVPFVSVNAKSISNTGYIGATIEELIQKGLSAATDYDEMFKGYAIIHIDEIDKLCGRHGSETGWYDSLQHSLLAILEGKEIKYGGRSSQSVQTIDSSGFTYVLSGNFFDSRKKRDKEESAPIGFNSIEGQEKKSLHYWLEQAGLIKELAGRISSVAELHEFGADGLYDILVNKEDSSYRRYQKIYKLLGEDLMISEEQLMEISKSAAKMGIGARGLNAAMAEYLSLSISDLTFDKVKDRNKFEKVEEIDKKLLIQYSNIELFSTIHDEEDDPKFTIIRDIDKEDDDEDN